MGFEGHEETFWGECWCCGGGCGGLGCWTDYNGVACVGGYWDWIPVAAVAVAGEKCFRQCTSPGTCCDDDIVAFNSQRCAILSNRMYSFHLSILDIEFRRRGLDKFGAFPQYLLDKKHRQ
jgi:hypothetical protein